MVILESQLVQSTAISHFDAREILSVRCTLAGLPKDAVHPVKTVKKDERISVKTMMWIVDIASAQKATHDLSVVGHRDRSWRSTSNGLYVEVEWRIKRTSW